MNVLHLNTDDSRGGAARAALRLHSELLAGGIDSRFLVKQRTGRADHIPHIYPASGPEPIHHGEWIHKFFVNRNTSEAAKAPFSLALPGIAIEGDPHVQATSLLHLHWVCHFLGPREIGRLQRLGKPVVWTLHDQWAMTAGCHYSGDCTRFTDYCQTCPQLKTDALGLAEIGFRDRLDSFLPDLTVVTPSEWMARRARRSRIFAGSRIEVIANCIDETAFRPKPKAEIRARLGVPPNAVVILFACSAAFERRKGAALFNRLATELASTPRLADFRANTPVWAMYIGWHTMENASTLPEKHLGFINDDEALCDAFNAADFMINLSSEDNLPNMVIEAMSCGTPVLALRTGGLPEIIDHLVSGVLISEEDFQGLCDAAIHLITDTKVRGGFSEMARLTVEKRFSKAFAPQRYAALYRELLAEPPRATESPPLPAATLIESKVPDLVTEAFRSAEQAIQEQQAATLAEVDELRNQLMRVRQRRSKRRFSQLFSRGRES